MHNLLLKLFHVSPLQVCVSSCPTSYWHYAYQVALETAGTKQTSDRATDMICKGGTDTLVVSYIIHLMPC
jgi:hypothetical protein